MVFKKNKKGMMNQLVAIGMGIVTLAIVVGIGLTVLTQLGGGVAVCTAASCGAAGVYNISTNVCSNGTSSSCATPAGTAYTAINYANTQLGSTGLLSWLPAIIALLIGVFFLMYFMGRQKKDR